MDPEDMIPNETHSQKPILILNYLNATPMRR